MKRICKLSCRLEVAFARVMFGVTTVSLWIPFLAHATDLVLTNKLTIPLNNVAIDWTDTNGAIISGTGKPLPTGHTNLGPNQKISIPLPATAADARARGGLSTQLGQSIAYMEGLIGPPGAITSDVTVAMADLGLKEIECPAFLFSSDHTDADVYVSIDLTAYDDGGAPEYAPSQVFDIVDGSCSLLPGYVFSASDDFSLDPTLGLTTSDPLTDPDVVSDGDMGLAAPDPAFSAGLLAPVAFALLLLHSRRRV